LAQSQENIATELDGENSLPSFEMNSALHPAKIARALQPW